MKPTAADDAEDMVSSPGLGWPVGDFYVPGFSSDGRTALVPGAVDTHRRVFLIRAARLEPELLATLRNVADDERAVSAWAKRWHLSDRWCVLLARETLRWWASHPEARGWAFQECATVAGFHDEQLCQLPGHPGSGKKRLGASRNSPFASSRPLSLALVHDSYAVERVMSWFGTRIGAIRAEPLEMPDACRLTCPTSNHPR